MGCRAGSLDVVKAQQMGVFPGPAYGALKAGEPVQTAGKLLASPLVCLHDSACNSLETVRCIMAYVLTV